MFDRLLALASVARAVEANAAGDRSDLDAARSVSAGARFASAVETSGATPTPADIETGRPTELRYSDRTTASVDVEDAKPGEHSGSGFDGVRVVQVGRQEHSWDHDGVRQEDLPRRDIKEAENAELADKVIQPRQGTSGRCDEAMRSDAEPHEDGGAEDGSTKRRREGEGIEGEKTEAGGRSEKKRRTTGRVASSKRDRIVRDLCPRCEEFCLLPKTLACDGCLRSDDGAYPCFLSVASAKPAASLKRTMPPGSHAKPRGRPPGLGKRKCMSCTTNACSHNKAGPPMYRARTNAPLAGFLLAWTAAVAHIRAHQPRADAMSIILAAGATAWGADWDWTEEDWGLQGARGLLPSWVVGDDEVKVVEQEPGPGSRSVPRKAPLAYASGTPLVEAGDPDDIPVGRLSDTSRACTAPPPLSAQPLSSPEPPDPPPPITTARTPVSPSSASPTSPNPSPRPESGLSLGPIARPDLLTPEGMLPGPGTTLWSEPVQPRDDVSTPTQTLLEASRPYPSPPPAAQAPSAVPIATPSSGPRCAPSEVPETVTAHGDPDFGRAMELISAGRSLDRLSADAFRLGSRALTLDQLGASPVTGLRALSWEYPPEPAAPRLDDPESILREYAQTYLPVMDSDSLRWAPRLPMFRQSLPGSRGPHDSVCTKDVIGGLVRGKVCTKEYSLDLVHVFLHILSGAYDRLVRPIPDTVADPHIQRLWVDGSVLCVGGPDEDAHQHVKCGSSADPESSAWSEAGSNFFLFLFRNADHHRPWVLCLVKATRIASLSALRSGPSACDKDRSTRVTHARLVVGQSRTREDCTWTESILARSRITAVLGGPTTTSGAMVKTVCLPKRYSRTGPIVIDVLLRLVSFWVNAQSGTSGPSGNADGIPAIDLVARFDELDGTALLPNIKSRGNLAPKPDATDHRSHELRMQSQQFRAIHSLADHVQRVLTAIRSHRAERRVSRDMAESGSGIC